MKIVAFVLLAPLFLAACGADGEPLTPTYSGSTTFGINSKSGPFNKTSIGVTFGN